MKRILTLVFTSICILSYAQDGINYQGAATDSNGDALVNQSNFFKNKYSVWYCHWNNCFF